MLEIYFNPFSLLFSDRDQDKNGRNCAEDFRGGWWFNACHEGYPTGLQSSTKTAGTEYISWRYGGARGNSFDSWAEALYELVPN